MQVTHGNTRFVVLVGDKAFKIARFKPLSVLLRQLFLPFSKQRREYWFAKYGETFGLAIWNEWCAGIHANRREFDYFQDTHDPLVIPTLRNFLNGFIIVQERGMPLSQHEFESRPTVFKMTQDKKCELSTPCQFVRTRGGNIVLVDYGRLRTIQYLLSVER